MRKRLPILILAVVMLLATCNFLYLATEKSGFHCDEIYSHGLSNSEFHYNIYDENDGIRWNTDEDIDAYMTAAYDSRFDYVGVYKNQIEDVHPPLFYIVMHTISSFMPGVYSPLTVILPNIIFALATAVFLYLIAMRLTKNTVISIFGVAFFLFSAICINIVIYMRMYAMLMFFTTAVIYITLCIIDDEFSNKLKSGLFITVLLGAYTQYYFLIFMFGTALCTCVLIWKNREKRLSYLKILGITAFAYIVIWPFVFKHLFFSGRGVQAFENAAKPTFFENLMNYVKVIGIGVGEEILIFSILLIFAIVIIIGIKKKKLFNHKHIILICVVSVFYFVVISKVAPFLTDRYISPIIPLFAIFFLYALHCLGSIVGKKRVIAFAIALPLIFSCVLFNAKRVIYKEEANYKNLNYLYRISEERSLHWENYSNKKCLMIHNDEWEFLRNLPDYKRYQETAFVKMEDIELLKDETKLKNEQGFVLYIHNGINVEDVRRALTEYLGCKKYELLIPSDNRNYANIYWVTKE